MRKLRRPGVVPPTLGSGIGHTTADLHRTARAADATAELAFGGHWNRVDVRGALYAMNGRACAYCNCLLPRNDRGDVEHFRPKALYWWLAYEFTNYVLACSVCNRIRKRERFPLAPGAVAVDYAGRGAVAAEARLLLDPVDDPVEAWIHVDFATDLCPLASTAAAVADPTASARVTKTIAFFTLNTDPGLVRERIEASQEALEEIDAYRKGAVDGSVLKRRASRFAAHGRTVRDVLAAYEPGLLPQAQEEVSWLAHELCDELEDVDAVAAKHQWTKKLRVARDELLWALAVLWKDPSAGVPADVEAILKLRKVRARVEPLYLEL